MKVKNKATIVIEFEGKDIYQRASCGAIMASIQHCIESMNLPVKDWKLESFTRVT